MSDQPSAPSPKRIQRKRTKGWRMPANAVYVGRPTKFGNPFVVGEIVSGETLTVAKALDLFRFSMCAIDGRPGFVTNFEGSEIDLQPLRGKDLACWCRLDQPCHADILLELANG